MVEGKITECCENLRKKKKIGKQNCSNKKEKNEGKKGKRKKLFKKGSRNIYFFHRSFVNFPSSKGLVKGENI